jgi:hypothetical protein
MGRQKVCPTVAVPWDGAQLRILPPAGPMRCCSRDYGPQADKGTDLFACSDDRADDDGTDPFAGTKNTTRYRNNFNYRPTQKVWPIVGR